jgi:Gpi18-like mannosyltransferase
MVIFKKYIVKVSLIFTLLLAGLLCVYTLRNYNGNTVSNQNRVELNGNFGGGNKVPDTKGPKNPGGGNAASGVQNNGSQGQTPGGQFQGQRPNGPMAPGGGQAFGGNIGTGVKYTAQIVTYSIIFLTLFIAAYWAFVYKKVKINPGNAGILILTLLGASLLLRISIATLVQSHPFDLNIFKSWATTASNNLFQVYSNSRSADYPPLYMYVLFLIGKLASIPTLNPYYTLLLKLPSIAADILSSLLIYKLARKHLSLEISMLLSAFYIFNPAVFINSTVWGQVDSFFTLIIITSVFMMSERKIGFSAVLFAAAVLMKPQGIIFLPVLFFELVRLKKFKNFLKTAAIALSTALVIILPFSLNKGFTWIFKLYSSTVGEYPYASVNAFNFFSLIGKNFTKDTATLFSISYHTWGLIFIIAVTLFSWFIYIKGNSSVFAFAAALIQIAGVFTFSSSMHERYLFPAAALSILAFIYLKDKRLLLLSVGFSTTIYMNTHYVLYETMKGINSIGYTPVLIFTSFLNVVLFIYLVKVLFDITVRKRTFQLI